MTKPKRYKRYSAELKWEAVHRATKEGMRDKAVCDALGIQSLDQSLDETSFDFGETRFGTFRRATFPLVGLACSRAHR